MRKREGAASPVPGYGDLRLIAKTDLNRAMARVKCRGVEIIEGPRGKSGALGRIFSFCFRDPDGSLIEASDYPAEAE